jgi:hypothetical protein
MSGKSLKSSLHEKEYDIIRDDIGYAKQVGKVFYSSIRSNSSNSKPNSKYVSEASRFKNPSDYESSRGNVSIRGDLLSGRVKHLSLFKLDEHKKDKNYNPVNTCTEGFFKNTAILLSPSNALAKSLNSTDRFKTNQFNIRIKDSAIKRLKINKNGSKRKSRQASNIACDTPKFPKINANGSSNHRFFNKLDNKMKVTQPEESEIYHRDEIHDVQVGRNMIGIINSPSDDGESY